VTNTHGDFVWYELMTPDTDGAGAFYAAVLGWTFAPSPQPDVDYRIFSAGSEQIGGFLGLTDEMRKAGAQPCWLGYVAVDDADAAAASITAAGGRVHIGPHDIPGTGRFALVADPQGVMFYILQDTSGETSNAFAADEPRVGHCAWNELATTDQAGAMAFYTQQFGWVKDGEMDMGAMGAYEFLRHGSVIGAMMTKPPEMPVACWSHYFRVADIDAAAATVAAHGGQVLFGPSEVPGGDYIISGLDPQGAAFSLVGTKS
jgi:predicted enzyme related to lactoylglutathione lyase